MGQIAFRFNIMQARLVQYINDVYITEIKYKNAAFTALQSQINPHFLSNTLEAIRMKAVTEGNEEVADMVYILSTLFRSTLKTDKIVKIKDEINHCELYLKLFSYRYRDKLQVIIDVDKKILNEWTGKLLLQPIVENSIFHGFDSTRNDNRIQILGERIEDEIVFLIEDNGKGISAEKLTIIEHKLQQFGNAESEESIGLINVHERIKFMFGEKYGLDLTSEQGVGTKVMIRIPLLKKEEIRIVQDPAG
jgi:two-component system sensor histidine kinase YesM